MTAQLPPYPQLETPNDEAAIALHPTTEEMKEIEATTASLKRRIEALEAELKRLMEEREVQVPALKKVKNVPVTTPAREAYLRELNDELSIMELQLEDDLAFLNNTRWEAEKKREELAELENHAVWRQEQVDEQQEAIDELRERIKRL